MAEVGLLPRESLPPQLSYGLRDAYNCRLWLLIWWMIMMVIICSDFYHKALTIHQWSCYIFSRSERSELFK